MDDIHTINLSYLRLLQDMYRWDSERAVNVLGVSLDVLKVIEALDDNQIVKLCPVGVLIVGVNDEVLSDCINAIRC